MNVDDELADGLDEAAGETVRDLVYGCPTAEFATLRDGKPETYPLTPFYDDDRGRVVVSSPPAYAGKVANVRADPRVSLLLHGADGSHLVTGEAVVRDDDLEANAEHVADLIQREPDSPKREANVASMELLDSRLGSWLLGWYALRVLVEIDPVSVTRVAHPASPSDADLSPWPAVDMAGAEASRYDRATLTRVGDDGYPVTRPVDSVSVRDGAAVLAPDPEPPPADGEPACLLAHWHDESLDRLGQRLVRGRFRTEDGDHRFEPGSSTTLRNDGILDTFRFIIEGKRRTREYFGTERWFWPF